MLNLPFGKLELIAKQEALIQTSNICDLTDDLIKLLIWLQCVFNIIFQLSVPFRTFQIMSNAILSKMDAEDGWAER